MIVSLSDVGRGDLARAGGKGASLGQRLQEGFPLPDGFVVTSAAYRAFVAERGLGAALERELAAPDVGRADPAACERVSAAIREAFEGAAMPSALEAELCAAWRALGGGPVAVRSSATAEDLPDASFAGQQETVLGVREEAAVVAAVRRCWSSLWTSRAIAYRVRHGFAHEEVSLAVVVQRMVEPEAAGVLFTVDPVGGRDEMVINASWGLGEAVVSGWVTPDLWRLSRADGRVLAHTVGSKDRRVVSAPGGGTVTEEVPAELRARLCLSEGALRELFVLGRKVEDAEGTPQDLEFAWAGGKVVLLQSRPVTTRALPPRELSAGQRRMLDDVLEHYPTAPLPLDEEPLQRGYEQLLAMARHVGLRMPPATELFRMDDDGLFRVAPAAPRPGLGLARLPWAVVRAWRLEPSAWGSRSRAEGVDLEALRAASPAALDEQGLLSLARRALEAGYRVARIRFSEVILPGALRGAWLGALARLAGERVDPFAWLGGLSYRTVEIEHGLQTLADRVLASPAMRASYAAVGGELDTGGLAATAEGEALLSAIDAFLAEHGARTAAAYLPFSARSWREDPSGVHLALRAIVRAGKADAAAARARGGEERLQALANSVRARLPRIFHGTFERTLAAYRAAHVAREASLYAIEEAYGVARGAMAELGRRLAARGLLVVGAHVVFARMTEVEEAMGGALSAAGLRARVARRRALREVAGQVWRAQRPVPARLPGAALAGTPGSPGVASGPVRVILGPGDFGRLNPGEVLVCPYTDPTWTPLFSLAAAVVSDTGGPLSHAAIVAREYGIPAVLGTECATTTLVDGEAVVVNGSAGLVHRPEPSP